MYHLFIFGRLMILPGSVQFVSSVCYVIYGLNRTRITRIKLINTDYMDLLHKDITDKISKSFYKVYNELGFGFLEKVYQNAMYLELVVEVGLLLNFGRNPQLKEKFLQIK
jgi:hypothetical protein